MLQASEKAWGSVAESFLYTLGTSVVGLGIWQRTE